MSLNATRLGNAMYACRSQFNGLNRQSSQQDFETALLDYSISFAQAIIDEFTANATVESLSCNQTTTGDPPHTHNVSTVESTGKIK
jgi:hypothetical protein